VSIDVGAQELEQAPDRPGMTAAAPLDERELPELVIEGGPGRGGLAALRELALYGDVISAFAVRHVKVKYKQAVVGIGWAVIQPVVAALLFALFLGHFAKIGSEGEPYILFALAGTVSWSCFSTAASSSVESLVTDQMLLRKVYFPREVLPIASVLAALVDFLPALCTVLVVAALDGVYPALSWVALPVPLLLIGLSALAFGIGLSGLNVYYRDVRYVLPFVLQLGLFVSPVVFSVRVVPARWRTLYEAINPMSAAIDSMRRIVVHRAWPQWTPTLLALAWLLVLLAATYSLFKRLERGFADRV
jgi:lipopolysaccharide transport system permease protein